MLEEFGWPLNTLLLTFPENITYLLFVPLTI